MSSSTRSLPGRALPTRAGGRSGDALADRPRRLIRRVIEDHETSRCRPLIEGADEVGHDDPYLSNAARRSSIEASPDVAGCASTATPWPRGQRPIGGEGQRTAGRDPPDTDRGQFRRIRPIDAARTFTGARFRIRLVRSGRCRPAMAHKRRQLRPGDKRSAGRSCHPDPRSHRGDSRPWRSAPSRATGSPPPRPPPFHGNVDRVDPGARVIVLDRHPGGTGAGDLATVAETPAASSAKHRSASTLTGTPTAPTNIST